MGKAVIQNTVGDEVAQLIRVALRDGFGGVKLIHGILLIVHNGAVSCFSLSVPPQGSTGYEGALAEY